VIFGVLGRSVSFGAASGAPIKTIQLTLAKMGLPVHPTGVLDQPTVDAVNGVFNGWDDAPPDLRTGRLTAHDIARKLPVVTRLVKQAAGGALVFPDVNG
jgi:hypothetical protein